MKTITQKDVIDKAIEYSTKQEVGSCIALGDALCRAAHRQTSKEKYELLFRTLDYYREVTGAYETHVGFKDIDAISFLNLNNEELIKVRTRKLQEFLKAWEEKETITWEWDHEYGY
jgi:hypothetical protein